ncbi:MAG: VCBS repeat-containing protein, partial [Chloroflexi bacterium]|nr:VCBS repeat-containing protein [Chloroflexota bacterium]
MPFDPSSYLPKGAKLVCTRQGDLDGDNRAEWLLLYMESVQTGIQEEKAMVAALRESGVKTYNLYRADNKELGEYELCDVTIGDFNKDGKTEIAISGGAGAHYSILSVFQWNGSLYANIGAFGGDGGTYLSDVDGDGVLEVIEGRRLYGRPSFLVERLVYS